MTTAAPVQGERTPWALYVALTLAVWGVFVFDRGLWQDDVQVLFRAFMAPGREGLFPSLASPTRRLLVWPSFLALASGQPVLALELMAGLTWLATAVVTQAVARRLWPATPWAHVGAAVLTLVATPDAFTNGLVGLGYLISILAYLVALLAGFEWLRSARAFWLVLVAACLTVSFWMTDAALLPWALTPLLWMAGVAAPRRRWVLLAALWYGTAVPYLLVLAGAFGSSTSYVSQALLPLGPVEWLRRWAGLALYNFEPWRWAWARPPWLAPVPSVVPLAWQLAIGLIAGVAVAWRLAGLPSSERAQPRSWTSVAAALVLMSVANAAFAGVQVSEAMARTHLLARVFAALALAGSLAALRARVTGGVLAALVGAWTSLGVCGGLERQDYFAAYWRLHRQELRSLLTAAPQLAAHAHLVLHVPAQRHYLATEAGYLARAWTTLLYQDPSVECRVFLWSARRPATSCVAQAGGLECRGERSPDCQRADGRESELIPYDRLVWLEYSAADNQYLLRRQLPPEMARAAGYAPDALLEARAPSRLARALVYRGPGLAERLWPEGASAR